MVEQVVCLVVKSPLANGECGASVLHLLHHVGERLCLVLSELFEVFAAAFVEVFAAAVAKVFAVAFSFFPLPLQPYSTLLPLPLASPSFL